MAHAEIREGFLCPICMQDLGTVSQLTEHFEQEHATEDGDVLNQLKGLFNKAKKKILKDEHREVEEGGAVPYINDKPVSAAVKVSGIDPTLWEPQRLGACRSHIDTFKRIRDTRIDRFVIETNKLLIRLDKLVGNDLPSEPSKRKEEEGSLSAVTSTNFIHKAFTKAKSIKHASSNVGRAAKGVFIHKVTEYDEENKPYEKTVVPWVQDSEVPLCPTCKKGFNVARRRHHCRLCGGIMCNKCSHFMPFEYARAGFHRSSSNSSLNSMFSAEGDLHIRTCDQCRALLERRDQQVEQRNALPVIVQLYEKLKTNVTETDRLLPMYLKMTDSINYGETTYSLEDAQMLRMKIMKLYEALDSISKRVLNYGLDNPEYSPSQKQMQLQRMIRLYASSYLQENLMGLQSLPNAEEFEKIKVQRQKEIQHKIEMEKLAAAERAKQKALQVIKDRPCDKISNEDSFQSHRRQGSTGFVQDQGWKTSEIINNEEDDPMVQQMNNIKGYIKQAKEADRWEEAQMFEENLRDLQQEYWKQKKQTQALLNNKSESHSSDNYNQQEKLNCSLLQNSQFDSSLNSKHDKKLTTQVSALSGKLFNKVISQKKSLNPFEDDENESINTIGNFSKKSKNPFED